MEAPDKIYIQPNAHDRWFEGNKPNDNFVEYIRKEALLEYLRKEYALVDFHLKAQDDPVWWGQRNAFQQVIDKLNSL